MNSTLNITKIKLLNSTAKIPERMSEHSAGYDIYSNNENEITLKPLQRELIPAGFAISLPCGYEAQIRPRSGLAIKSGITVLNSPGTIDSDYRGEVKVVLINLSDQDYTIKPSTRIAQMISCKHEITQFNLVDDLDETVRGYGGFGHTNL